MIIKTRSFKGLKRLVLGCEARFHGAFCVFGASARDFGRFWVEPLPRRRAANPIAQTLTGTKVAGKELMEHVDDFEAETGEQELRRLWSKDCFIFT